MMRFGHMSMRAAAAG